MVKHKLPIEYNSKQPIGVFSVDAYNYLLLDKLFDDFRIISPNKQSWLTELPVSAQISNFAIPFEKATDSVSKFVSSKKFVDTYKSERTRKYVMYSPLDPPYKVNPLTFLMNSPTIAHAYENKRYFRDEFADLIRVPEYEIKYMNELDRAASFRDLWDRFEGPFILQDEESSGSKGTHAVRNYDDYLDAVRSLKKFSRGRTTVASKFIEGEPCSIQVCITKYGIFSGGIQRQLVDSKDLCNLKLEGAAKWCGGEIGNDYPEIVQHRAQEIASVIGSELSSHGYKGIFGVDLIVTADNDVYAIEINARMTGYSHIISDLQLMNKKIPFMLLHVLELGNFNYEVTDSNALPSGGRYNKPGSLLIINNKSENDYVLKQDITPGVYKVVGDKVEFVKTGYSLSDVRGDDMFLLFCRYSAGESVPSGRRIVKVMKLGKTMAKSDINKKTKQLIGAIKNTFDIPA